MRFLRVSFIKDIQRLLKDPASLATSILIPLVIGTLIKLATGGDGGSPTAKLLVADHDQSFGSTLLVGMFSQEQLARLVEIERTSETEGRERMEDGKASGLLIIPEGFTSDVLDRHPTTLHLITNPSQRILPGILKESLATVVDGINSLQSILENTASPLLDQVTGQEGVPSDALVSELSVAVNRLMARAEPFLLPPAIKLETVIAEEKKDSPTFGELFFPSMFFLAIVFAAQSLSDDLWKERMAGTLRRTVTTPGRLSQFMAGKLLAAAVALAAVALVALVVGKWLLRIPFQNLPLAVLWVTASGVLMLMLFTLIQLSASSQRGGHLLTAAVLFPLIMAGGTFFPFEVMPDWLAAIGKLTPNGWALTRFKELVGGALDPQVLVSALGGMAALGAGLYLLCLGRLSRFARG